MRVAVTALAFGLILNSQIAGGAQPNLKQGGQNKTYVTHNCTGMKIKPRRILFACGDGNFFVTKLRWHSWHKRRATGHGKFHANDCDPDCADGQFHTRKGRLKLRGRMYCEDKDKYSYARARITYRKPLLGKKRVHFKLFCPF
jgi:hypothetical protein